MTIHNKVIDHLNHVPTISVGISGTDINNQEEDISDSINHSPTSLLITAMSGWGWDLNHKVFSLGGNNFPKSQSSQCSHASSPKCPKYKRLCVLLTSRCRAAWCLRSIYPSQFVELGQPVLFSGKGRAPDATPAQKHSARPCRAARQYLRPCPTPL